MAAGPGRSQVPLFSFPGVTFLLWVCLLVLCATLGYAHSKTNILMKVLPTTDPEELDSDREEEEKDTDHRDLIQKYRNL